MGAARPGLSERLDALSLDGLSDEEGFDEEAELEAYYAEQQRQQEDEARC